MKRGTAVGTASLKLLFWLKFKLTLRGYQRNSTAAIGVILSVVVMLPLAAMAAYVSYMAYVAIPSPMRDHVLQSVLLGAYCFWVLSPLFGFALNESFDVTRLFLYPITVRQILIGAIAGSVLDFPVLFLLPSMCAALIGFSTDLASAALIAVVLILFLGHTLALGQSVVLATSGMLRSRKYRDLLMVVFPLVWIVYYIVQEMMRRGSIEVHWSKLFNSLGWKVIGFLPPGMAAHAISEAGRGSIAVAAAWTAGLLAATAITIMAASTVIQRVYAGDTEVFRSARNNGARISEERGEDHSGRVWMPFGLRLPPESEAVYWKEARYMARDPSFKATVMNLIYTLLVAVFMVLPRSGETAAVFDLKWMVWPAGMVVLMTEVRFFFNLFGTEGAAASLYFLFPTSRRRMIIGKNAIYMVVGSIINLILAAVLCIIARAPGELPYLLFFMVLATCIYVAAGNFVSVLHPTRVVTKGWRVRQASAGQGCAFAFIYVALSFAVSAALLPVLAALALPRFWLGEIWLIATIPIAIAYVVCTLVFSISRASRLLLDRELDVMRKLGAEE